MNKIAVATARLPEAIKELTKLVKRANKAKQQITFSLGGEWINEVTQIDVDLRPRKIRVPMTDILVEGDAPKIGEYTFIARVELHEGGNLIDSIPGETVSPIYWHSPNHCDHCNQNRRRKHTFICRDKSGQEIQVGKSCLRDFTGIDSPEHVLAKFEFLKKLSNYTERQGDFFFHSIESILSIACTAVRLHGWKSRNSGANLTTATMVSMVICFSLSELNDENKMIVNNLLSQNTLEDQAKAAQILQWVRSLNPSSDYEHNLHTICQADYCEDAKRIGLIASAVASYMRANSELLFPAKPAAPETSHLGTEGERLRGLTVTFKQEKYLGEGMYGPSFLQKFTGPNGEELAWFTSKHFEIAPGAKLIIDGTVKKHSEYKGAKQTQLTRCKIQKTLA